ncbi:MAG: 3'(2'),5'-bisphosphate nucleotidase [Chloroflexi bacterium]|nr:3'(2'),5'-bisphosphate nucleotidase [Chloroflexota bacterium]
MIDLHHPEYQFAAEAVRQAALLARRVQARLVTPALTKDDRSPVTVADFAAQALAAHLLSRAFPDDALIGEENAAALRQEPALLEQVTAFVREAIPQATPEQVCAWIDRGGAGASQRFWTLDPIDGTKGFLRGDQYVVALALIVDGRVQVGALGCPCLRDAWQPDLDGPGSLVIAARGQGTWTTPLQGGEAYRRLSASPEPRSEQARLLRSFEAGHTNVDQIDEFVRALGIQAAPVRMDSQAKYAVLAAGQGELLVRLLSPSQPDYREKIWDQAAGSIVIEEAGGRISDLHGKPLDFTHGRTLAANRGVLASNGRLHPAALSALASLSV